MALVTFVSALVLSVRVARLFYHYSLLRGCLELYREVQCNGFVDLPSRIFWPRSGIPTGHLWTNVQFRCFLVLNLKSSDHSLQMQKR